MARIRVAAAALGGALVLTSLLVAVVLGSPPGRTPAGGVVSPVAVGQRQALAFEPSPGRFGRGTGFLVRDRGTTLAVGPRGSAMGFVRSHGALRTRLVGGAANARPHPLRRLPGVVNWYVGARKSWRSALPTFAGVRYARVYPGVDVVYHGQKG